MMTPLITIRKLQINRSVFLIIGSKLPCSSVLGVITINTETKATLEATATGKNAVVLFEWDSVGSDSHYLVCPHRVHELVLCSF